MRTIPQIFEVGGKVRDELLGIKSKDADFSFVLTPTEAQDKTIQQAFRFMKDWMLEEGFKIFLETEDCLTIRAKFGVPKSSLEHSRKKVIQSLGGVDWNFDKPFFQSW